MKLHILTSLLFSVFLFCANAQDIKNIKNQKPVNFSGSISTTANIYHSSDTSSLRDPFTYILNGNFNLSLYGINMPFSFIYSNKNFDYAQPFNRVGFSPEYKWAKLHLGYRTVNQSSFTLAGHSFLGAGVELNPGKFRASYVYGRFKKKTVPNTINPLDTLFTPTRKGYSVKLGYGSEKNYFDLILLKIADDSITNQQSVNESYEASQGNMVIGSQFKFTLSKNLTWETEAALSLITRDLNLDTQLDSTSKFLTRFSNFFTINQSSEYATAIRSNLQYSFKAFSMGLQYRRIDPNYQSFGAYYFNTDLENITANTTIRMLDKKLIVKGDFGVQTDNLQGNKARNSKRIISRFVFDYNPGKIFGLNGTFSNYSINQFSGNLPLNDTIKLYQSNRNIALTPRLTFVGSNATQMFMLNLSFMDLIDHNEFTADNSQVSTSMIMFNYVRSYQAIGLTINTGINRTNMATAFDDRKMTGISASIGKSFLENKLNVNLSLTRNTNKITDETNNTEYSGKTTTEGISAYYKPQKNHMFKCNMYFNGVKYPETSSAKSYNESKILLSYVYTFH